MSRNILTFYFAILTATLTVTFGAGGGTLCAETVRCAADARWHVQGVDCDGTSIYWSFTTVLYKTDLAGNLLARAEVAMHHGDCAVREGRLYVSVGLQTEGKTESFLYVYSAADLAFLERIPLPDALPEGPDGIAFYDGFFYIAPGKPKDDPAHVNRILKYTPDFKLAETFEIPMDTYFGVQAMTFAHGAFWLGIYGRETKAGTIQTDPNFNIIAEHKLDTSVGVYALPASKEGAPRLAVTRIVEIDKTHQSAKIDPAILRDGQLTFEPAATP